MIAKDQQRRSVDRSVPQLPGNSRPHPALHLLEYEMEDDLVLYDPRKAMTHILNPTAAAVWWLCDGERSSEEICARLADLYGVEPATVVKDVEETLCWFHEAGLVTRP